MTEPELSEFLDANKEAILAASKTAIIDKITETMKWQMPSIIGDTVNTFLKEEIAPEIAKHLKDQKGPILEAVKKSAAVIGDEVAKQMTLKAAKALDGYGANAIFKSLFGIS